jgi:putative endonuclease
MKEHCYYAYIVANASKLLYIGFTNDIEVRTLQHKKKELDCITKHWNVCRLVHFESYQDVHKAIAREKQLKRWTRAKKIALIEAENPDWRDLSEDSGKPLRELVKVSKPISWKVRRTKIKSNMKAAKAAK